MKISHIVLIVLIGAVIATIFATVYESNPYSGFDEAKKSPDEVFQIIGDLDTAMPINYFPQQDANYFSFYMNDDYGHQGKVIMYTAKPTHFEKRKTIIVTGRFVDSVFVADKLNEKCPSKYQEKREMQEQSKD